MYKAGIIFNYHQIHKNTDAKMGPLMRKGLVTHGGVCVTYVTMCLMVVITW